MKKLEGLAFPSLPDTFNSKTFHKLRSDTAEVISEIIKRQKSVQFHTKNRLKITDGMWEEIYIVLEKYLSQFSPEKIAEVKNLVLPPFFVSKLHLTFGDRDIVLLLSLLLIVYVLGISENQVNALILENEVKVTGIDVVELHQKILEIGGETKKRGLITDMYFDRYIPGSNKKDNKPQGLLGLDGRQIRSRQMFLLDSASALGFSQKSFISGKRELSDNEKTNDGFRKLRALFDSSEQHIKQKNLSSDMKLLFEEEMEMQAQIVFENILQIIKINNARAKLKQRVGDELENENGIIKAEVSEDYFWARSTTSSTGFIPPFSEFELPLGLTPKELLEDILGLRKYQISKAGSKKFFEEQGASEAYLHFMRGLQKDNETIRRLLQYQSEGMQSIAHGYYNRFPERLAA